MKKRVTFLLLLILLALPVKYGFSQGTISTALKGPWGIGIKAGLDGIGLEFVKSISNQVNLRTGISGLAFPYLTVQEVEGFQLEIDAKVRIGGANLLLDFYPVKGIFHLTGGLVFNLTHINLDIRSLSSYPYGDIQIPAEEVGTLTGQIDPGIRISPYLAIGVGNTLPKHKKISFNFELGALYQGHPRVSLTGTGLIGPMASEYNTLEINRVIAPYTWFPIVSLMVTYRIR